IASCLRAAAAHGRRVPNDVKLLAYDGTSLTRIGAQTVTAVRQPIEGLAALAAKKIVARAEGTADTLPWILKPSLIKGETC
ncbi:MAG: substrate-binding domain-containing protein, partial [Mitsuokella sp.]